MSTQVGQVGYCQQLECWQLRPCEQHGLKGNKFFEFLSDDCISLIFEFSRGDCADAVTLALPKDDKALFAISRVCRAWCLNRALHNERVGALVRLQTRKHKVGLRVETCIIRFNMDHGHMNACQARRSYALALKLREEMIQLTGERPPNDDDHPLESVITQWNLRPINARKRLLPGQENEYPSGLVWAFQRSHRTIQQLPALDASNTRPRPGEMPYPVMQFRDSRGRIGLAVHIQRRNRIIQDIVQAEIRWMFGNTFSNHLFRQLGMRTQPGSGRNDYYCVQRQRDLTERNLCSLLAALTHSYAMVMILWKVDPKEAPDGRWDSDFLGHEWSHMRSLYSERFDERKNVRLDYPIETTDLENSLLRDLLTDQDPDFRLADPVPQNRGNRCPSGRAMAITAMSVVVLFSGYMATFFISD